MADADAITSEGLHALRAELEHLEGPARREVAERIRVARDFGDLKENSEYHDAKNDQALLETRIARLNERLRGAVVVEAQEGDVVGFGSTVHVRDESSGRESTYRLVGSTEADPRSGRLSAESPVARALVGRRVGEEAVVPAPRGERRLRVIGLGEG